MINDIFWPVCPLSCLSACRCGHARLPAVGGGRSWTGLQPVLSGTAVGVGAGCSDGVQEGDGGSAVLLEPGLWQQHLPERLCFRPARPLQRGDVWESGAFYKKLHSKFLLWNGTAVSKVPLTNYSLNYRNPE